MLDELPNIFPDYTFVTIPNNVAPLNFGLQSNRKFDNIFVKIIGNHNGQISSFGKYADFDINNWHNLIKQNDTLKVSVFVDFDGSFYKYKDFEIFVSDCLLNDYGVTYRKIAPGYETFSHLGIYQRDISNFGEDAILTTEKADGSCMNCHFANRCNPDFFNLHVRGKHSATIINYEGKLKFLNTKTDSTIGSCAHGNFHPSGNFIAYSLSPVKQSFYVSGHKYIDSFDELSDVVVLDIKKNQLILSENLLTKDFQTYPAFSPDGKQMYFCSAKYVDVPKRVEDLHYDLCKIGFNENLGEFVGNVDTVLKADNQSIIYPRPSFDGKYLMFTKHNYGQMAVYHKEADLWMINLQNDSVYPLKEANSDFADSFHSWSSDSRWFVFSSRRADGLYSLLYFAMIDSNGSSTKPFLLPQKNPQQYYLDNMYSFNAPDFTSKKVEFDMNNLYKNLISKDREQVEIKK